MTDTTIAGLMAQAARMGVTVTYRPIPADRLGVYIESLRTIIIDSRLNQRQTRCALCHELIHAAHHDIGWSGEEPRTRRETALTLITPQAYRQAEKLWQEDIYHIALQLNVTVDVAIEFQRLAHDDPTLLEKGIEE